MGFLGLANKYDTFSGGKMGLRFLTNLFKIKLLDYYMFLSWGFNVVVIVLIQLLNGQILNGEKIVK